jgi:hypothetical protein
MLLALIHKPHHLTTACVLEDAAVDIVNSRVPRRPGCVAEDVVPGVVCTPLKVSPPVALEADPAGNLLFVNVLGRTEEVVELLIADKSEVAPAAATSIDGVVVLQRRPLDNQVLALAKLKEVLGRCSCTGSRRKDECRCGKGEGKRRGRDI